MTNQEAIKFLQQLYPNGGHCWLDEQRIEAIGMAVKVLQEEPVSEDLEEAASRYAKEEYNHKSPATLPDRCIGCYAPLMYAFKAGAEWKEKRLLPMIDKICGMCQKQQDFINSKDLGGLISTLSRRYPEVSFAKLSRIAVRVAKWQKENLWNPADGDDLPEYDREVVVFTQNFPNDAGIMSVAIAHRPNPDGWDGKSLSTGKVEHYTPKTYGKGGWNIPDVKYWLDVKLPKEIEL